MSRTRNPLRGWLMGGAIFFVSLSSMTGIMAEFAGQQAGAPASAPGAVVVQPAKAQAKTEPGQALQGLTSASQPGQSGSQGAQAPQALDRSIELVKPPVQPALPSVSSLTSAVTPDGLTLTSLYVPYTNQVFDTDRVFDGKCACGPTSLDMVLAYYGRLDARPVAMQSPFPHLSQYGWAITDGAYVYGDTTFDRAILDCAATSDIAYGGLYGALMVSDATTMTEWSRMNDALTAHGLSVTNYDDTTVSYDVVKAAIDQGHPVILTTRGLTSGGHLIVVVGYTSGGGLIVNDPFGYKFEGDGYPNYDGANVVYTWEDLGIVRYAWEVSGNGDGWQAQYFNRQGVAYTRYDSELDFDWGLQGPGAPLTADLFSARWTRKVWFGAGTWNLSVTTEGDVRVLVDGQVALEQRQTGTRQSYQGALKLSGGTHTVQVEYRHNGVAPAAIQVAITP